MERTPEVHCVAWGSRGCVAWQGPEPKPKAERKCPGHFGGAFCYLVGTPPRPFHPPVLFPPSPPEKQENSLFFTPTHSLGFKTMASNQDDTTVQVNKEELRRASDLVIFSLSFFALWLLYFLHFGSFLLFFCFLVRIPKCAPATRRVLGSIKLPIKLLKLRLYHLILQHHVGKLHVQKKRTSPAPSPLFRLADPSWHRDFLTNLRASWLPLLLP